MSRTLNKKESELTIEYTIQGEQWENAKEKARKALRANVQIDGFRKGHVPAFEADKRINPIEVYQKALDSILDNIYKEQIISQITKDDEIVGHANLRIKDINEEKAEISFVFPLFPEVKLGDYKKLGVKLGSCELTKKDLNDAKSQIASNYVVMLDSKEPIKEKDQVNFNFKGFIDGKPFDGGEAENFDLVIGSKQFIPGFEDKMIGLKAGEEKDLDLIFPEDYHAKNLAGKSVVFHVKINFVKTPNYPTIDDNFVKEINLPNVKNVAEFEEYVKFIALKNKLANVKNEFINEAVKKLSEQSEVSLSESLVEEEADKYYQNFLNNLKQQQITEKDYYEFSKSTKEESLNVFKKQAQINLKQMFVLGAIAKAESLKVTLEDYEKEVEKLAKTYGLAPEHVKQILKFENVENNLINERISEILLKENDTKAFENFDKLLKEVEEYEAKQTQAIVDEAKRKREEAEKIAKESKENIDEQK
ncbi:trigger factor [Metamycoplasma hominis]|uniref:trigger factor n=1 Tax=Metamycoplasma hominis TaxID=2098 RepID=UPI003CE955C1